MANITITVKGVPGVNEELLKLARRYHSKAKTRRLIRPAAQKMRDELRKTTKAQFTGNRSWTGRQSTGNLARSIRTFSFRRSRGVHVGPRVGGKGVRGLADGYYFGWHDQGTRKTGFGPAIKRKGMIERTMQRHGDAVGSMIGKALIQDLRYL